MNLWNIFYNFFISGGPVMWPILAVSVIVWILGLNKLFELNRLSLARRNFFRILSITNSEKPAKKTGHSAYDSLLVQIEAFQKKESALSFRFREFMIRVMPELDKTFSTMSAWISVAPLLGLLGTVAGMIETFRIIQIFGTGNPHMMSEGISIALLTTQAGLTAAFPGMLLHNYLYNKKAALAAEIIQDYDKLCKIVCQPLE